MCHVLEAVAREAGVEAEEADDRREAAPEGEFSEVGLDDRAEHDELAHRVRGEPLPEPLPLDGAEFAKDDELQQVEDEREGGDG